MSNVNSESAAFGLWTLDLRLGKQMSNVLDEVVAELEPLPDLVSVMTGSRIPVLLGLDIGTSGIRAALFDEQGGELEGASVRMNSRVARSDDFGSIDADDLVEEVADALDALFARLYGSTPPIELISVSCFWHSLVGVDDAARATTPVFSWADSRSAAAANQLRSELDEARVHARTGCRFHPSYWPAKLRRLKSE
ncbi:MAG: FGGY family carbohydrate kinase, partial [Acidobacteriota bacterium]|nr:FGGY family carbohydrate kinase [Acidobacteriota bacterium]